jgi:YbbR domain-containing protein
VKTLVQRYRPRRSHVLRLLGSLVLALVVWIYVTISRNPETQFPFENVFVQVRGLASGFVLTNAEGLPLSAVDKVAVTLWAPESEHLGLSDLRVFIDLSSVEEPGTYEALVQLETEQPARTWTVTPQRLTVRVEQLRQELFPIQVVLLGQPGLPYIVGTPQVDPARAVVQGPVSRLDLVDRVEARVDLAGRVAAVENAPVEIVAVDESRSEVDGVTVVPTQATLSVPISLKGGHLAVSVVPVTAGRPATGYYLQDIEVDRDTVTIFSGDPAVLASVRYLETAPVDLSGRQEDFTQTVPLRLPANVSLINSPTVVTVTVHLGAIVPELRLVLPVRLEGLEAGLEAAWKPQWLDVQLNGSPEALRGLVLDDLWAVVDASGLDVGEYDLPINLPTPPGVEISPLYTATAYLALVRPATPTPTPTPTPFPTLTPVATATLTPTPSPTGVGTPTPSPTGVGTPTPSPTGVGTPMPTGSSVPTPTPTPGVGLTPTATRLPSPTP